MSSMGQSSSMPASQSTTVSSGQLIHSGWELAGAGVTSPGVAGAPATAQPSASAASASDIFSRLMETLSPQSDLSNVNVPQVGVDRPSSTSPVARMSRSFTLTPHQRNVLGSSFGNNETQMRDYLLKAIGSNDASLGPYTAEQMQAHRTQASARNVQGAKAQVSSFKSIIGKALEGYRVS